jgi:tRNA threonylcarbamoyladenosine biosynthesis protein TsaB
MSGMCTLAIEAATDQLSIAASCNGRVALWEARPARDETQRVFVHAARLLADVGGSFGTLQMVAFGRGPGSFTGVRVAAAAAQALAFAGGIPVCRVSSLAVLAAGAARVLGATAVGVCLDAHRQRAYAALYRTGAADEPWPEFADALVDPDDFSLPGSGGFVAAGEGWQAYPRMRERHGARITAIDAGLRPSARDLLVLAARDLAAGRTVSAAQALPEYLDQGPQAAAVGPAAGQPEENA